MKKIVSLVVLVLWSAVTFATGTVNAPVPNAQVQRIEQLVSGTTQAHTAQEKKLVKQFKKVTEKVKKIKNKNKAADLNSLLVTIGLILIIVGLVAIVLGLLGIGSTISGGGALVLGLILYLIGKYVSL